MEPLEALKTPLGAIELNVVLAGLEGSAAMWLGAALITDRPLVPHMPTTEWTWGYAVAGLFLLVGVILLGLCVEGLAGLLERLITWSGSRGELRGWYARRVHQPSSWHAAQRWIWQSPQASGEFARRRLRLLTARNTAFVSFVLTLALTFGLPAAKPPGWAWKLGLAIAVGAATTLVFLWVWVAAQQGYNRAVQDAADLGGPQ